MPSGNITYITAYSGETVEITSNPYDFIGPADQCSLWVGTYNPNAGVGGILLVQTSGMGTSFGTPYILVSTSSCALPSSNSGGLTGSIVLNGFTGTLDFTDTVYDTGNDNLAVESNYIQVTSVPAGTFIANAGADATTVNGSYTFNGSASGGVSPYANITWTIDVSPIGTSPSLTGQGTYTPTISDMDFNGIYVLDLAVEDALGAFAYDSITITRTGATSLLQITAIGTTGSTLPGINPRELYATVSGGTPPYTYSWLDVSTGDQYFSSFNPNNVTTSSTYSSTDGFLILCNSYDTADAQLTVTDSSVPAQSIAIIEYVNVHCFPAGTKILFADGGEKNIEDLKVGDKIKGTRIRVPEKQWSSWLDNNPDLTLIDTTVLNISEHTTDFITSINDGLISATYGHPILTFNADTSLYYFKPIEVLKVGDYIIDKDGNHIEISKIDLINQPNTKIYEIDTTPWNTYIANRFIVHNKSANCF